MSLAIGPEFITFIISIDVRVKDFSVWIRFWVSRNPGELCIRIWETSFRIERFDGDFKVLGERIVISSCIEDEASQQFTTPLPMFCLNIRLAWIKLGGFFGVLEGLRETGEEERGWNDIDFILYWIRSAIGNFVDFYGVTLIKFFAGFWIVMVWLLFAFIFVE